MAHVTQTVRRDRLVGASSPWSRTYLRTSLGVFSLAFMFAFEVLAVAAVMPAIATDLNGLRMYALAFSAPLAAAVVALVISGPWIDRKGPGPALSAGLVGFCGGLLVAGFAPTMAIFILGRILHGFGGGLIIVALYVVVAQVYPQSLRPRVFALLSSAWVLPAFVGPFLAATVAAAFGWRWVFLGVAGLAVLAWLLLRGSPYRQSAASTEKGSGRRVGLALVAGGGVIAAGFGSQLTGVGSDLIAALAAAALLIAAAGLLPAGTFRAHRGLPSVVGTRGLASAAQGMAEAYLPLLLVLARGLSLTQAGWILTVGAVTWWLGAAAAARWRQPSKSVRTGVGLTLMTTGIVVVATIAATSVPLVVPVFGWVLTGLGMGLVYSIMSVTALDGAPTGTEGKASSALALADNLALSGSLAVGGIVFGAFATSSPITGATVLVIASAGLSLVALIPASRLLATGGGTDRAGSID